jgi:hypothetical protein
MSEVGMSAKGDHGARAISGAGLAVALVALIGAFAAAGEASAGELAYKGCITGDSGHPSGPRACIEIPSASPNAVYSGLGSFGPKPMAVSRDRGSVYAGSWGVCAPPIFGGEECTFYAQAAVAHPQAVNGRA